MKIIIISGFMLLSGLCHGQVKRSIDKITGDTTFTVGFEKLYGKPSLSGTVGELLQAACMKDKNGKTIAFSIRTGKTSILTIDAGSKAHIKLKNDQVVTLNAIGSADDYFTRHYGSLSAGIYTLTDQDISTLEGNEIKVIRIETSDGNFDYDIKDKFSTVIQKMVIDIF